MEGKLGNDCVPAPVHEGGSGEGSGLICGDGGAGQAISGSFGGEHGVCAICLDKIKLQETALVKGCEHAYCVTCILRWATYKEKPSCPQCKNPFDFLNVHRSIDGCIYDYMFEESVCLLLRASWFVPLAVVETTQQDDGFEDDVYSYYYVDDLDEDLEDSYYTRNFSTLRIGNRRWGDSGYVRAGRKEARPVNRQFVDESEAGPSRPQKKNTSKEAAGTGGTGRRAKRALKREAADKAAAAKNQQFSHALDQNECSMNPTVRNKSIVETHG